MTERETGPETHFVLTEPGPYLFPDVSTYEGLDNLGTLLILRVLTREQRLWIPVSYPAAKSLVTAEEKEVPFETLTGVRPLKTVEMADPVEMPLLGSFVCFRGISSNWRLCEFLTEHGKRVLFSCSAELYRAMIRALKKRWPSPFAGRNVVGVEGMPRHERRLTSQEGVRMGAQTLAYRHRGMKPEDVMLAWSQMQGTPAEQREIWNRFWTQRGVDLDAPKPQRSRETVEKFLRRLDPQGKVTFVSTRKCPQCEYFFSTRNRKRKYCSDICEAAVAERNRPVEYHADFQRLARAARAAKRAKAQRLRALKAKAIKRCGFCGNKHTRNSAFCTLRCQKLDAAQVEAIAKAKFKIP